MCRFSNRSELTEATVNCYDYCYYCYSVRTEAFSPHFSYHGMEYCINGCGSRFRSECENGVISDVIRCCQRLVRI